MSWTVAKAYSAAAPTSPASSLTAKLDLKFSISDVSFSWKSSERSFCSRISSSSMETPYRTSLLSGVYGS